MLNIYKFLFLVVFLKIFQDVTSQSSQEAPEKGFLKREFSLIKPYSGLCTFDNDFGYRYV